MDERELDYSVYTKVMGLVDWETDKTYWEKDAIPHYSTDIAAAWLVVEKMNNPRVAIESSENEKYGKWFVMFGDDLENGAFADTAPLAICLAALRTVGAIAAEEVSNE